jgi:predicted permease
VRLLLAKPAAERALSDLEDVYARQATAMGRGSARAACVREAWLIVAWSVAGRWARTGLSVGAGARSADSSGGGWRILRETGDDVRIGVRSLLRRPGFALLSVGVLALGIGANVTIFTLANRLFLSAPAGVEAPGSLVRVFRSWAPGEGGSLSHPTYADLRTSSTTLSGLAAYSTGVAAMARLGEVRVPSQVWVVSDSWFSVLGLEAAAGRFFREEENAIPDRDAVAVLSYGFWQQVFGGTRDAIGREVVLNGTAFIVIGVAPAGFRGLGPGEPVADVYVPIMMRNAIVPTSDSAWRERIPDLRENWLSVIGRLRPGVSFEAARAELVSIGDGIAEQHPQDSDGETVHVTQQFRYYPGTARTLTGITRLLLIVVAVVLAVAAANAAILLLSRASGRAREMGVRAAIGAGRGRVVRLLLVESVLLGLAGGALAVVLSWWGARAAGTLLPIPITDASPDGRVLVFALALSLVTAVVVGTAPALRAARANVIGLIQDRGTTGRGSRLQSGLVVLQVALSLVLVTGASVFARSLAAVRSQDIGFETRNALILEVDLRNHGYDADRGRLYVEQALERLGSLSGVRTAATTRQVPFQGDWSTTIRPWGGVQFAEGRTELDVNLNAVSPGYFEAMGMRIVRGRALDARDRNGSAPVVVVNEAFADAVWPGQDAVGRTLPVRGPDAPPFLVVGVVRNATYLRIGEAAIPHAWMPVHQVYQSAVAFLLRTQGEPLALAGAAREALAGIDPDVATRVTTLEVVFDEEIARFRVSAQLVGLFGVLALVLAAAGLYGVLAFYVVRRTREIGVCMALGATRQRVARDVLRRGLTLAAVGVALGTAAAFSLAGFLRSMLFEISVTDPFSFTLAPLVLLATATLAVLVPVRRAITIDPMRAIRD